MTYTLCPTLQDFFAVEKALIEKGLVYVPSQTNPPKSGVNYVKQHGFLFSTCSEYEYEENTNDEQDI